MAAGRVRARGERRAGCGLRGWIIGGINGPGFSAGLIEQRAVFGSYAPAHGLDLDWYPAYTAGPAAWGLAPLEDQLLAGLIVWLPGGVLYTLLATLFFLAWLGAVEKQVAP
ncbi:MAG TPA: cytochrome c oxidase assembly protein [Anaerolineales bacterium]